MADVRGWNQLGQFEMSDEDMAAMVDIPGHLLGGISRYIIDGVPPGSFVRAVFENDLFEAIARADAESRYGLFSLVKWIHNHTPSACHGSPAKVAAWIDHHAKMRAEAKRQVETEGDVTASESFAPLLAELCAALSYDDDEDTVDKCALKRLLDSASPQQREALGCALYRVRASDYHSVVKSASVAARYALAHLEDNVALPEWYDE